jgi:hypothetical protein
MVERLRECRYRLYSTMGGGIGEATELLMTDDQYVLAWREAREETVRLLTDLNSFLDVTLKLAGEADWSEDQILRWRHDVHRSQIIFWYAQDFGALWRDQGHASPATSDSLPIPYPMGVDSDEERKEFREGFFFGAKIVGVSDKVAREGWDHHWKELEGRLATPPIKKPSGG